MPIGIFIFNFVSVPDTGHSCYVVKHCTFFCQLAAAESQHSVTITGWLHAASNLIALSRPHSPVTREHNATIAGNTIKLITTVVIMNKKFIG